MVQIMSPDHWSYRLPLQMMSMVSFVCLVAGLGLVFIGTVYPQQYLFDINKPARVMERIEQYYVNLARELDMIIIVGMGALTLSAFLTSFVLIAPWSRGQIMYSQMEEDTFLTL